MVVFLAVIFLLGYIVVKNERKIETFISERVNGSYLMSPQDTKLQHETIRSVFRNYLGREPTKEELDSYSRTMMNSQDVISVVDAIKGTNEYKGLVAKGKGYLDDTNEVLDLSEVKDSPLIKDLRKEDFNKRMETYRKVIDVYQKTLDRMPSNKELVYYSHRLLTDNTFNEEKMRIVLEGSNEYKILEKNQRNMVNGELAGNLTDAQITMDIRNKYKSVFGTEPDQDTMDFLKSKYISYKLDEQKFDKLLILIRDLESGKDTNASAKDAARVTRITSNSFTTLPSNENDIYGEHDNDLASKTHGNKNVYNNPNIINIITPNKDDVDMLVQKLNTTGGATTIINKSNGFASSASCVQSTRYLNEDPFYKMLEQAQKSTNASSSCQFDADVSPNPGGKSTEYSNYMAKRNLEEMNIACKRSEYYKYIPEQTSEMYKRKSKVPFDVEPVTYSIEPDNSATLDDAKLTTVGSILPPFVYRENAYTEMAP